MLPQAYTTTRRAHTIAWRGRIAFACCFIALAFPMVLNLAGLTSYDPERSSDDPLGPSDRSFSERLCLAGEWMAPACALVGIAARVATANQTTSRTKSL